MRVRVTRTMYLYAVGITQWRIVLRTIARAQKYCKSRAYMRVYALARVYVCTCVRFGRSPIRSKRLSALFILVVYQILNKDKRCL